LEFQIVHVYFSGQNPFVFNSPVLMKAIYVLNAG